MDLPEASAVIVYLLLFSILLFSGGEWEGRVRATRGSESTGVAGEGSRFKGRAQVHILMLLPGSLCHSVVQVSELEVLAHVGMF